MTSAGVPSVRAAGSRKLIHLGTAVVPVAWSYGFVDVTGVRILLVAAVGVALVVEWARGRAPAFHARFQVTVGALLKPHEDNAITGATWLAMAMLIAVVALPEPAATTALWAGAVGDPAAALAGGAWQRRAGLAEAEKSLVGSATGGLVTALGAVWLGGATVLPAGVIGAAAAAAEWPRRLGDDNLRVTLVAGAAAWLLGVG